MPTVRVFRSPLRAILRQAAAPPPAAATQYALPAWTFRSTRLAQSRR